MMEQVQADLPYKAFPAADGVVERSLLHPERSAGQRPTAPARAAGYYRADDLPDACNYSHGQARCVQRSPSRSEPDTTGLDTD